MNAIKLESSEKFKGNIETLRQKFEEFVTMHQNETNYSNTEGSLTWIIRGSIDFFNKLLFS